MFKIIKLFKSLPLRSSRCIPRNRKFFSMHLLFVSSKGRHCWALLFAMSFFMRKVSILELGNCFSLLGLDKFSRLLSHFAPSTNHTLRGAILSRSQFVTSTDNGHID